MRRRERTYFLVLGALSAFSLLGGAWLVPLAAYALLELTWSAVEWLAARRMQVARATAIRLGVARAPVAGGILRTVP
jgi:Kef-type K+ transport system membrane component KefB